MGTRNDQNDAAEQLRRAGKDVARQTHEAARQVRRASKDAARTARRASLQIDFDGLFDGVSDLAAQAVESVTEAVEGLARAKTSPYIVEEKGASTRGWFKIGAALALFFFAFCMALSTFGSFINRFWPTMLFFAALTLGSLWLGRRFYSQGTLERDLANVLSQTSRLCRSAEKIGVEELAARIGMPLNKLRGLLTEAVVRGLIPQGRLAKVAGRPVLYLTEKAYADDAFTAGASVWASADDDPAYETDGAADPDGADGENTDEPASDAERVLAACEAFCEAVATSAPQIQDADIRFTATELAQKVATLMGRIRKEPEIAGSADRFASYYLPMAKRMVESTADLDREGAYGKNANDTRAQVASTLKMLSEATTRLLDELLRNKAWDVSADAGVMRTMLQQDGLAPDSFGASASPADGAVSGDKPL